MPYKRQNRFSVGAFVRRKREVLQELTEEKVKGLSAVKNMQQQIRRLKDKVLKFVFNL